MRFITNTILGIVIGAIVGLPVGMIRCLCGTMPGHTYLREGEAYGPSIIVCAIIGGIIGLITALVITTNEMEERTRAEEVRRLEDEKRRKAEEANIARINREKQKEEERAREVERVRKRHSNADALRKSADAAVKKCSEQVGIITLVESLPFTEPKDYVPMLHIAIAAYTTNIPNNERIMQDVK